MLDRASAPSLTGDVSLQPDLSASVLLGILEANKGKALVFHHDGRDVQPGYHVTEVKSATLASLDCGANPETWRETIIQLWDVPGAPGEPRMSVDKFLAIMGKVSAQVPFDRAARLIFEVSDGVEAMRLLRASGTAVDGETLRVFLAPQPASCKPRDRWLEQSLVSTAAAAACCGARQEARACCA
jgi:hypothetical protein